MTEPMPLKTVYTGMACAACMKASDSLLQCSACKRAKYCSRDCQKSSWSRHKPVCKILREFKHVSDEINSKHQQSGLRKKYAIMEHLFKGTGGEIDVGGEARNFVTHSKICSVCFKTDYEFDSSDQNASSVCWKKCPACLYGWCCSEDHWNQYKMQHTPEICASYVRASDLDRFHYNHAKDCGETLAYTPDLVRSEPMETFPASWEEYYQVRSPDLQKHASSGALDVCFFPAATRELTLPVTCLYGMYFNDPKHFCAARTLNIHVVGADPCCEFPPSCVWEEILHVLPTCQTLHISFIGPEIVFDDGEEDLGKGCATETCPDCQSKKRKRIHSIHCTTYHDYASSSFFTTPDFVVAYNTGMYEEDCESWQTSLRVLLDLEVPCLFTSYNLTEAKQDYNVLEKLDANLLTDSPILNPLSDMALKLEPSANVFKEGIDQFYQGNMYCMLFNGLRKEAAGPL